MHGVVETLRTSYIPSFDRKDRTHSMQYMLYEDINGICGIKGCFTKTDLEGY